MSNLVALKEVEKNLRKIGIGKGDLVLLGFSGGADSLCLFYCLDKLKKEFGYQLIAAHLNHGFRQEASLDEEFCRRICCDFGVEFHSRKVDCAEMARVEGLSSEEAGRLCRYDFFKEVLDDETEFSNKYVALAHNFEDQCETCLFRIIRGSGVRGLSSMALKREDRRGYGVIRPLLTVERKDIENLCRSLKLEYCSDSTNFQPIYTRNMLRLDLIPKIEKDYNPNFKEALARLISSASEIEEYLYVKAKEVYLKAIISDDDKNGKISFNADVLRNESFVILKYLMMFCCERLSGGSNVGFQDFERVVKFFDVDDGCREGKLGDDLICYLSQGVFSVEKKLKSNLLLKQILIEDKNNKFLGSQRKDGYFLELDLDKLRENFCLEFKCNVKEIIEFRARRTGDFLRLAVGRKKLKNFLIDRKVPKNYRDDLFMLAIGNEIIWIPEFFSYREGKLVKSSFIRKNYLADENSKTVIFVEVARII